MEKAHYIVAIGASAGGLEAIHEFFDNMPEHGNLSYVIIQHLSPDYKSMLVELVSKHTNMQVREVGDNMPVEKNCVYVIPNNKQMIIQDGRLQLLQKPVDKGPNTAIDTFLFSLAKDKGRYAIAVILSGTGTDGTKGADAIKRAGGLVIVQDPATAKFDGMPRSVIASEHLDYVLPPEMMPSEIYNYIQDMPVHVFNGRVDEETLSTIFQLVKEHSGLDFHHYKPPTIMRRVARRMSQENFKDLESYVQHLQQHPAACKQLARDFLIGVTRFFRDKGAFNALQELVLPQLVDQKEEGSMLKVWVAACSTGEEAYTVAMVIDQYLQSKGKLLDVKIFATDIDAKAVDFAARASYTAASVKEVDPVLLKKYFVQEEKKYVVAPRLRKQIVFARHNILKDPPFIKNDLICCRNMLIYMDNVLQRQVLSTLHFALNSDGFLMLSPSESAAAVKNSMTEISSKWRIYRKRADSKPDLPVTIYNPLEYIRQAREVKPPGWMVPEKKVAQDLLEDLQETLSEEQGYAALYVDSNCEIKEAIGNFKKYLALPDKKLHLNLLKMVPKDLSIALNLALRQAWKTEKKTSIKGVKVTAGKKTSLVNMIIKPAGSNSSPYTLIVLNEDDRRAQHTADSNHLLPAQQMTDNERILQLEAELQETRANLQMAIEGLETSNEELQSSNEELLSANEELQSSNEELQSLNEELHTLNTEHQLKIKELLDLNDDMNNYFRSVDIGQVLVDSKLRIRKFNTAAVKMINLIESDIGRPIHHISTNLVSHNSLIADIQTVIRTRSVIEKEVTLSNDHTCCLMRIMPYLRQDKQVDGVVITFVDITTTSEQDDLIKGIFNSSISAIMAFKAVTNDNGRITDFKLQAANKAADEVLGKGGYLLHGRSMKAKIPQLSRNGLFEKYAAVVQEGTVLHTEAQLALKQHTGWYEIVAVKIKDGVVITCTNITAKKEAEENLRRLNAELEDKVAERTREALENLEEKRFLAEAMPLILWTALPNGQLRYVNREFISYTGISAEESLGDGWRSCIHPGDLHALDTARQEANEQKADFSIELRIKRADGVYRWFLTRCSAQKNAKGDILLWVCTSTDVHEQKMLTEIMEQRVRERTTELEKANKQLEASNAELQQYAFVASHDLKEPLRKIHMFSNMIKDKYLSEDPVAQDYMNRVIRASSRMSSLINDLLRFSRLSLENFFEPADLNEVVQDILSDLEIQIQEKKAEVTVGPLPIIEAIPGQMRQIFQNLLSNAFKFSRREVRPVINISAVPVKEKSFDSLEDPEGEYYRITISDNGIGFDEQYLDKIFSLFQRLHTKDKYEGTGIGLAVTRKIVDKHNGIITARSKEGEGSTFILVLPAKQHREADWNL